MVRAGRRERVGYKVCLVSCRRCLFVRLLVEGRGSGGVGPKGESSSLSLVVGTTVSSRLKDVATGSTGVFPRTKREEGG